MAPVQGKDSSSSMLQRPYQAVALQDVAHCDIHTSLQGDIFTSAKQHLHLGSALKII